MPGFFAVGIGLPFSFIPLTIAALAGVKDDDAGLASGLVNASYQVGSALGLAVVTAIATSATGSSVTLGVLNHGYHAAFVAASGIAAAAAVVALVLIRRSSTAGEPDAPVEPRSRDTKLPSPGPRPALRSTASAGEELAT